MAGASLAPSAAWLHSIPGVMYFRGVGAASASEVLSTYSHTLSPPITLCNQWGYSGRGDIRNTNRTQEFSSVSLSEDKF